MSSATGIIRCPPYCRTNCATTHHPLLVALLNTVDTADVELMEKRLQEFREIFMRYTASSWKVCDDIPDANEQYRFPVGHWACALGRIKALAWILKMGFKETTQCGEAKDTMLHKALTSLQETSPNNAAEKFRQMVPLMKDSLCLSDKHGLTILHKCCDMLRQDMPRSEFFLDCLSTLVAYATLHGWDFLSDFLHRQNQDGDTALHILARSNQHTTAAQILVEASCDLDIKNKEGFTAVEVAADRGSSRMGMYLNFEMYKRNKKSTNANRTAMDVTRIIESQSSASNSNGIEKVAPKRRSSTEEQEQRRKKAIMKSDSIKVTSRIGPVTEVSQPDGSVKRVISDSSSGIHIIPDAEGSSTDAANFTSEESTGENVEGRKLVLIEDSDSDEEWLEGNEREDSYIKTKEGIAIPLSVKGTSFFNFIKVCDSKTRDSVYHSLAQEKYDCEKSISLVDYKFSDIKERLDETQTRQKKAVDNIQNLLWRLNQLQEEESKLSASISKGNKDQVVTSSTLKGLKERLQHCQAALDALHGL